MVSEGGGWNVGMSLWNTNEKPLLVMVSQHFFKAWEITNWTIYTISYSDRFGGIATERGVIHLDFVEQWRTEDSERCTETLKKPLGESDGARKSSRNHHSRTRVWWQLMRFANWAGQWWFIHQSTWIRRPLTSTRLVHWRTSICQRRWRKYTPQYFQTGFHSWIQRWVKYVHRSEWRL